MNINELILALQQYPGNTKVALAPTTTSYSAYHQEITSLKLVPVKPALQLYSSFFENIPTTNNKILLITAE
jgi:hypothetical protein